MGVPGEMLPLDRPGHTSDDALVIYGTTKFSSLGGLAWLGARCAVLRSAPTPPQLYHWAEALPHGFTLLLLHGSEILKGECAHRGSPEGISLHDGFQSGSAERKARHCTSSQEMH